MAALVPLLLVAMETMATETMSEENLSASDQAMLADVNDERVPVCLYWSAENVAEWITGIGIPQYKSCFLLNNIDGSKLIHVTMSTLPRMGITDYKHMKMIMECVKELLLGARDPPFGRSPSLPPRELLELYLEQKSNSGANSAALTYAKFLQCTEGAIWQPPSLSNMAFIFEPQDRMEVRAIRK